MAITYIQNIEKTGEQYAIANFCYVDFYSINIRALSQENLCRELTGSALDFGKKIVHTSAFAEVGSGQRAVMRCDSVLLTTASL